MNANELTFLLEYGSIECTGHGVDGRILHGQVNTDIDSV